MNIVYLQKSHIQVICNTLPICSFYSYTAVIHLLQLIPMPRPLAHCPYYVTWLLPSRSLSTFLNTAMYAFRADGLALVTLLILCTRSALPVTSMPTGCYGATVQIPPSSGRPNKQGSRYKLPCGLPYQTGLHFCKALASRTPTRQYASVRYSTLDERLATMMGMRQQSKFRP